MSEQSISSNNPADIQGVDARALAYVKGPALSLSLIGGRWVPARSGEMIETVNPATGEVLTSVALPGPEDINDAVKAARAAFENPSWSKITPHERSNYLLKIADAIAANIEELAATQTLDMGLLIAQSRALVAAQVDVFRYYAGWPIINFTGSVSIIAARYGFRQSLITLSSGV